MHARPALKRDATYCEAKVEPKGSGSSWALFVAGLARRLGAAALGRKIGDFGV